VLPGESAAARKVTLAKSIQIPAGALVTDNAGNLPTTLSFAPPAAPAVKVDGVIPGVKSLGVPASKTYKIGDVLAFRATFTKPVYVSGTPTLVVTIGNQIRLARFTSGAGTTTLLFSCTVAAGDLAGGGIVVGSRINLDGGTIRDGVGNPASPLLPGVKTSKVIVDGIAPGVVALSAPAPGTYKAGQSISFTTNYSEKVVVSGKPRLQAVIGVAMRDFVYAKGSGTNRITFSYTILPGDLDADGIALQPLVALAGGAIRDQPGNAAPQVPLPSPKTTGVVVG